MELHLLVYFGPRSRIFSPPVQFASACINFKVKITVFYCWINRINCTVYSMCCLTHFSIWADVIRRVLSTPSQSSSQYVSDRGVNMHDLLSLRTLNTLPRCAQQGRHTIRYPLWGRWRVLDCSLAYLPSDVTSLLGKQETVGTTWHPRSTELTWEWSWSREQSERKNNKNPLKGGFFLKGCIARWMQIQTVWKGFMDIVHQK